MSADLWFVIGRFPSILLVSVFQGSLAVAIFTIDNREKQNSRVIEKPTKIRHMSKEDYALGSLTRFFCKLFQFWVVIKIYFSMVVILMKIVVMFKHLTNVLICGGGGGGEAPEMN